MAPPLDQLIAPVVGRARMAGAAARLAVTGDPRARSVRRVLRRTLFGRADAAEREWIDRIERRRAALLADPMIAEAPFDPAAAGAAKAASPGAPVSVASRMLSLPPLWCLLLMRLIRELRPRSCLELGAGFGISTAYAAAALRLNGAGTLTTIEGSPALARQAQASLGELGLDEVRLRVDPIAEVLPQEATRAAPLEFVFIDAEHQTEPTVAYFDGLLPSLAAGALVVLDDLEWPEMRRAYAEIAGRPRVSRSIPVGRVGLTTLTAS